MKKFGRKPRVDGKKSSKVIGFKATPEEWRQLQEQAVSAGLSLSDLIRSQVLGSRVQTKPLIPAINREAYAELARTASNINQLTRHLNEGRITGRSIVKDITAVEAMFREMDEKVEDLRRLIMAGDHDRQSH